MDELETFQAHLSNIASKWGCSVRLVDTGVRNQTTQALRIDIANKTTLKTIGRVLHNNGTVTAVCALHGGHPFWWSDTNSNIPLAQIIDRLEDLMASC